MSWVCGCDQKHNWKVCVSMPYIRPWCKELEVDYLLESNHIYALFWNKDVENLLYLYCRRSLDSDSVIVIYIYYQPKFLWWQPQCMLARLHPSAYNSLRLMVVVMVLLFKYLLFTPIEGEDIWLVVLFYNFVHGSQIGSDIFKLQFQVIE